jgi:hypothetical protein
MEYPTDPTNDLVVGQRSLKPVQQIGCLALVTTYQ